MKRIYAIVDLRAEALVSTMLMLFAADAAAVRWFQDGLTSEGSLLQKHPEDFELRHLGSVDDDGIIDAEGGFRVVLTGAAWLASQKPADDGQLSLLRKEA